MSFKKGEDPNRGKGGKRQGAGRKSNEKKAEEKIVADRARKRLEADVDSIMDVGLFLATGKTKGGVKGLEEMIKRTAFVDPRHNLHMIDKWIPPAKHEIDISTGGERINYTYTIDANKEYREEQERRRKAGE